jgi:hypothetical protein
MEERQKEFEHFIKSATKEQIQKYVDMTDDKYAGSNLLNILLSASNERNNETG